MAKIGSFSISSVHLVSEPSEELKAPFVAIFERKSGYYCGYSGKLAYVYLVNTISYALNSDCTPRTQHMQGTVRIDDKSDIVVDGIRVVVRLNEELCCAADNKDQNYEKSDK